MQLFFLPAKFIFDLDIRKCFRCENTCGFKFQQVFTRKITGICRQPFE